MLKLLNLRNISIKIHLSLKLEVVLRLGKAKMLYCTFLLLS